VIRDFKSDDYLYLANALAGGTAGRGRPRTAFLRRATSTAYYALFHELVQHGARRAAGTGPAEHRQAIGRWYAHGNSGRRLAGSRTCLPDVRHRLLYGSS
jgi:hypothetical protein